MRIKSLLIATTLTACVTSGTYHDKINELNKQRDADNAAGKKREDDLDAKIKDLTGKLADVQGQLDKATADKAALQKQVDDGTANISALEGRLKKLGQNVDSLTTEKAETAKALEELRKQKALADARAATFRNLVAKLHSMIDSGQLKVVIRDGRMIIALPNDILFESGKTELKPDGIAAIGKVAQVLATVPDRHFLVAGHTDDLPIHTAKFPSNWELSTARAVNVVELLVQKGMSAKFVAAAGYGEFDPLVANDSPEHRAQNRRIEIVLQANISDLPSLDDVK